MRLIGVSGSGCSGMAEGYARGRPSRAGWGQGYQLNRSRWMCRAGTPAASAASATASIQAPAPQT